jgi:hypothetical protein
MINNFNSTRFRTSNKSPLIIDGDFQLDANGLLVDGLDIETQLRVSISQYDTIYNAVTNSLLIPYLNSIPIGGIQETVIVNIVKNALQPLISLGIIQSFQISTIIILGNNVTINISVLDAQNNSITLSWTNPQ